MTPPNTSMNTKIAGAHVLLHRLLRTSCDKKHRKRKDDLAADNKYVPVVLLCKRTHDAPIHPGYWGLFGGNLKNRESPRDGAKREVDEELGIILKAKRLEELCSVSVERANGTCSIQYFRYSLEYDLDKLRLHRNNEGKVEGE